MLANRQRLRRSERAYAHVDDAGQRLDFDIDSFSPVFFQILDRLRRIEFRQIVRVAMRKNFTQVDATIQSLNHGAALDVISDYLRVLRLLRRSKPE